MSSLPQSMRYVHFESPGGPQVLELRSGPLPTIQDSEVLIQTKAFGINRPDIAQRSGTYPPPPGASPILGLEASGTIAAIGKDVKNFRVGQEVCALTPGGAYAEYCKAPASHCLPLPKGLGFIEGAGIPETFFTVWSNVVQRGNLKSGETFLVHGGTSGIGSTAIQLAKALGAKVITTVGSQEKETASYEFGADHVINYKQKDFVEEIKQQTFGKGVDLILDMVGGSYFERNLKTLALDGRLVQIAALEGAEVSLHLFQMMMKRITITGSTLRPQSVEAKARIADQLQKVAWPLLEEKKVKVIVDRVYPMEEIQRAHERMESSKHIGKIIISTEDSTHR